jgi:DNA (cytosine-5)-methyltransferase 1
MVRETPEFTRDRQVVETVLKAGGRKYKVIEGFCGPGGMSSGLKRSGFDILSAFDVDPPSVETHNANLGNHAFVADARNVRGSRLLHDNQLKIGELDLFAGGPPCQGFSKQKRGAHLGDTRNDLINEYVRIVGELKPRFFFFENVAIFGQKRGREYIAMIHEQLAEYEISNAIINSADFGLPQARERFLVVGRRRDVAGAFHLGMETVSQRVTVGHVLAKLPEPPEDYSTHPEFPNHQRARVTALNIKRFSYVPQGGGWKDIPKALRLPCHQRVDTGKGGWPDVYGRMEWDGLCPTITGGFDSFTRGRYGHPLQDRPLTPREAARIQGFPDHFHFMGSRGDVRSQIGNAVPPPVAYAVGTWILKALMVADGSLEETQPFGMLCEDPAF